jgi:hypothetical protein
MGYYDRDLPPQTEQPPTQRWNPPELVSLGLRALVRLLGLAWLMVGLWAGYKVITEAWQLYQNPSAVQPLAQHLARASGVDSLVAVRAPEETTDATSPPARKAEPDNPFRLSYFLAWGVTVLMLLLIGKLATWAIRSGGELVLFRGHGEH